MLWGKVEVPDQTPISQGKVPGLDDEPWSIPLKLQSEAREDLATAGPSTSTYLISQLFMFPDIVTWNQKKLAYMLQEHQTKRMDHCIFFLSTIFTLFSTPPQPSTLNPKP